MGRQELLPKGSGIARHAPSEPNTCNTALGTRKASADPYRYGRVQLPRVAASQTADSGDASTPAGSVPFVYIRGRVGSSHVTHMANCLIEPGSEAFNAAKDRFHTVRRGSQGSTGATLEDEVQDVAGAQTGAVDRAGSALGTEFAEVEPGELWSAQRYAMDAPVDAAAGARPFRAEGSEWNRASLLTGAEPRGSADESELGVSEPGAGADDREYTGGYTEYGGDVEPADRRGPSDATDHADYMGYRESADFEPSWMDAAPLRDLVRGVASELTGSAELLTTALGLIPPALAGDDRSWSCTLMSNYSWECWSGTEGSTECPMTPNNLGKWYCENGCIVMVIDWGSGLGMWCPWWGGESGGGGEGECSLEELLDDDQHTCYCEDEDQNGWPDCYNGNGSGGGDGGEDCEVYATACEAVSVPSLTCTEVVRGDNTVCTVELDGALGAVAETRWRFHRAEPPGLIAPITVHDTTTNLAWSGTAALSGTVTATVISPAGESIALDAALTVKDRQGWSWTADYTEGGGATCRDKDPWVTGAWAWLTGQAEEEECRPALLVTPNPSTNAGFEVSEGSGPNRTVWYVSSMTTEMRLRSNILPALRANGRSYPVGGPGDLRNGCRRALRPGDDEEPDDDPDQPRDSVNIRFANIECAAQIPGNPTSDWAAMMDRIWTHERAHADAALGAVTQDPHEVAEGLVQTEQDVLVSLVRGVLISANDAALAASAALDGGVPVSFKLWLPRQSTTVWHNPNQQVQAMLLPHLSGSAVFAASAPLNERVGWLVGELRGTRSRDNPRWLGSHSGAPR